MAAGFSHRIVCTFFCAFALCFAVLIEARNVKRGAWNYEEPVEVIVDVPVVLKLRGLVNLPAKPVVAFSRTRLEANEPCPKSSLDTKHITIHGYKSYDDQLLLINATFTSPEYQFLYACVSDQIQERWTHQGLVVKVRSSPWLTPRTSALRRSVESRQEPLQTFIIGIRAEGERSYIAEDGSSIIAAKTVTPLRLYGHFPTNGTRIMFTTARQKRGEACDPSFVTQQVTATYQPTPDELLSDSVLLLNVKLPETEDGVSEYYICVEERDPSSPYSGGVFRHQGHDDWMKIKVVGPILPLWFQVMLIALLLVLSGLFSGLNLGLMALDKTELQVIAKCGSDKEKKYAKTIAPLRSRGNYLLCSLLLGNVLVNTSLTILLDDLTSGLVAVIGATIGIVLFGEIIPQAICSRHGLAIGAKTVNITKFFMVLTFPVSYPISKILDRILGEEIGNVYDRERLMEFIRVTKDYNKLENEEVNIISGALELKKKTVSDVMTKIEDVYMISYDVNLNFETMSEIMKRGYTRVPVYDSDRNNIVALLNIKDLAFVDPDDNTPLKTLCEFYNHPINFVFEDETLDVMLNEFKKGQSHMAFVRHVHTEDDTDPFYEIVGVVTLEDVIEEIIQSEIIDESDILTDNRRKLRRFEIQNKQDFSDFAKIGTGVQGNNIISPQLALATFQYLSTAVEPFKKEYLSETVLRRLLTQNLFFSLKFVTEDSFNAPAMTLYRAGKPADYFVLIVEGRVRVTVGKENLVFEAGPFTCFGAPAIAPNLPSPTVGEVSDSGNLVRSASFNSPAAAFSPADSGTSSKGSFIPDYSVVVVADTVFMKVHRNVYLAALRATMLEQTRGSMDVNADENMRAEWENVVSAVNDNNLADAMAMEGRDVPFELTPVVSSPYVPELTMIMKPSAIMPPSTSVSSSSLLTSPGNHRHFPTGVEPGKRVSIEVGGVNVPFHKNSVSSCADGLIRRISASAPNRNGSLAGVHGDEHQQNAPPRTGSRKWSTQSKSAASLRSELTTPNGDHTIAEHASESPNSNHNSSSPGSVNSGGRTRRRGRESRSLEEIMAESARDSPEVSPPSVRFHNSNSNKNSFKRNSSVVSEKSQLLS